MNPSNYFKKLGKEFICRLCSYDIKDISGHLVRETDLKASSSQLSRVLKEFKNIIESLVPQGKHSPRIRELISKLREND